VTTIVRVLCHRLGGLARAVDSIRVSVTDLCLWPTDSVLDSRSTIARTGSRAGRGLIGYRVHTRSHRSSSLLQPASQTARLQHSTWYFRMNPTDLKFRHAYMNKFSQVHITLDLIDNYWSRSQFAGSFRSRRSLFATDTMIGQTLCSSIVGA